MVRKAVLRKLASPIVGAEPPARFRLFESGVNHSELGDFIFDDRAAALVMRNFELEGVYLMIDLEHDSLDD